MIRQLIIVYQWVVDRWGWVYICRYFSDWNILHSHIFWLQKLASWDWARGQPNCDSWIYVQNTNYSESFYIGLCFLPPLTPIWKKNIKISWYTSFFLEVLSSRRNSHYKIEIVLKVPKKPILWMHSPNFFLFLSRTIFCWLHRGILQFFSVGAVFEE